MARHKHTIKKRGVEYLDRVMTIRECMQRWPVSYSSVYNAIRRDHVCARKSGGTWLITTISIVDYYGLPIKGKSDEIDFKTLRKTG